MSGKTFWFPDNFRMPLLNLVFYIESVLCFCVFFPCQLWYFNKTWYSMFLPSQQVPDVFQPPVSHRKAKTCKSQFYFTYEIWHKYSRKMFKKTYWNWLIYIENRTVHFEIYKISEFFQKLHKTACYSFSSAFWCINIATEM